MVEQKYKLGHYYKLMEINAPLGYRTARSRTTTGWFLHMVYVAAFTKGADGMVKVKSTRLMFSIQRGKEAVRNRLTAYVSKTDIRKLIDQADRFMYVQGRVNPKSRVHYFHKPLWDRFATKQAKRMNYQTIFDKQPKHRIPQP